MVVMVVGGMKSCGTKTIYYNANTCCIYFGVGIVQQCIVMEFAECNQASVKIVVQVSELLNPLSVM